MIRASVNVICRPALFCSVLLLLLSCSSKQSDKQAKMITVSIPPQAYFINRLAGSEYRVNVLVPPGMSPETYEPSPGDLEKVANSTFCFLSGYLDFESQLAVKLKSWKNGPLIVDMSDYVDVIRNVKENAAETEANKQEHRHVHGNDPHYWMSPREMKKVTVSLCRLLSQKNPSRQSGYEKQRDALLQDLDKLDSAFALYFKDLKTRKFIVFHPSLAYMARDYSLEQLSLEHEGKQPSTRQMAYLVEAARKNNLHTVFLQAQFESRTMETFAREIGGKLLPIDPLSADWLKNMYSIGSAMKEAMNGK